MYFIPLILFSVFKIIELLCKRNFNYFFYIGIGILTFMACFRYGQGQDYFGYMINYYMTDTHNEIGYVLICDVFHKLNIPFEILVICFGLFQMFCIYRFIVYFSSDRVLSLVILYPTIFLTYVMSGLRQGTVLAFFLGVMLKWLKEKQWVKYYLACILLSSIHSSALILLIVPVVYWITLSGLNLLCILSLLFGVVLYFIPKDWLSFIRIGSVHYYLSQVSPSFIGLAERIVMFILLSVLYINADKKHILYDTASLLFKVYYLGVIISLCCFPWGLISSRLGVYFKATELVLIPIFVETNLKWKKIILSILFCYVFMMTTKNIMTYISQGKYEGYNIVSYPFLNVFNKEYAWIVRRADVHFRRLWRKGFIK